jgi:hypothetical protein
MTHVGVASAGETVGLRMTIDARRMAKNLPIIRRLLSGPRSSALHDEQAPFTGHAFEAVHSPVGELRTRAGDEVLEPFGNIRFIRVSRSERGTSSACLMDVPYVKEPAAEAGFSTATPRPSD